MFRDCLALRRKHKCDAAVVDLVRPLVIHGLVSSHAVGRMQSIPPVLDSAGYRFRRRTGKRFGISHCAK